MDEERPKISSDEMLKAIKDMAGDHTSFKINDITQASLPLIESGADDEGAENVQAARAGKGRPKGSRNKTSDEWANYILTRYRSPLIVWAETYSQPTTLLAAQLNCTLVEAFKIQIICAKELAPYVHHKMPQAIDVGTGGLIPMAFALSPQFIENNPNVAALVNLRMDATEGEFVEIES